MTRHRIIDVDAARSLGTVLGIWAHPDDEAYLSAGLMALARDAGNHVTCVTATLGEHGTDDPGSWPPERLARTRRMEVTASLAVLGVGDHRLLGYEDGTLPGQPTAPAVATIADVIEEVRPDTIVTFGPDGVTGHPDHRTISAWATAAWERTRCGRLLYATTTAVFADEHADLHQRLPVFGPGLPLRTAEADVALVVELDEHRLDQKLAALRAQATQVQPLVAAMGEATYRTWWRSESFRAAPGYHLDPAQGGARGQQPHHRARSVLSGAGRRRRGAHQLAAPAGGRSRQAARPRAGTPSAP